MRVLPDSCSGKEKHPKAGFTLVEVAIVLLIIGLLVGGVFSGREMIKNAQLRALRGQIEQIEIALNAFRGKYNALPGDMPNATQFWADAVDGDGNYVITGPALGGSTEKDQFFTHLYLAGFIENDPLKAKMNGVTFSIRPGGGALNGSSPNDFLASPDGSNLWWSDMTPSAQNFGLALFGTGNASAFTPDDARSFDAKFDDGWGATGKIGLFDGCLYSDFPGITDFAQCSGDMAFPHIYGQGSARVCNLIYWPNASLGGLAYYPNAC